MARNTIKLGTTKTARPGLTGWGKKTVSELWLVKCGKVDGKQVYAVMGFHKDENGNGAGWGHLYENTSLADVRAWMENNSI